MQFIDILSADQQVQAQVRELRNHRDVKRYMYSDHDISEEEHRNWLRSLAGNSRQHVFVIKTDDRLAGVVSLSAINSVHRTADWAFYLDPGLQGKGLGSLVEFWLLDHAFNEAGLEKLNCEVLASNPAVIKMHQKFGFQVEGVRRQNIIKDGQRVDVVLLGITQAEWRDRRPDIEPLIARLNHSNG